MAVKYILPFKIAESAGGLTKERNWDKVKELKLNNIAEGRRLQLLHERLRRLKPDSLNLSVNTVVGSEIRMNNESLVVSAAGLFPL